MITIPDGHKFAGEKVEFEKFDFGFAFLRLRKFDNAQTAIEMQKLSKRDQRHILSILRKRSDLKHVRWSRDGF